MSQLVHPISVSQEQSIETELKIVVHTGKELKSVLPQLSSLQFNAIQLSHSQQPSWLEVLRRGLGHTPYCLQAIRGEETVGFLALAFVHSKLFGRFLVSLPYLNYGGPIATDEEAVRRLIDQAVQLADSLDVQYLELRGTSALTHPALNETITSKVHMKLGLPNSADALWESFTPKVRNQIRKGEKSNLSVLWGGRDLLSEFYSVFAHNMRDLGTPVFGRKLFRSILEVFENTAEICLVRQGNRPVAGAILLHGRSETEVPSASSLRQFNNSNANMLMYWHLLKRSIDRGQAAFDFGRSSLDSGTFRFKAQWGAQQHPAVWQYYVRRGNVGQMRPESPRYRRAVQIWQRLPLWLTRTIGPAIVRGIP
jgi:FemAB-related protein (PEP-CTERM system-associated)